MTPNAASAFLAMSHATTAASARLWIDAARRDGATDAECAAALTAWESLQAESVQRIESQPTPPVRCLCSHARSQHSDFKVSGCLLKSCGCTSFRPHTFRRPDTSPSVNEYLRQKGEIL